MTRSDELIRQVTVSCIEQGLLLFRIRNELRMTINAYQRAYESGVKFGLNKAIWAELKLEQKRSEVSLNHHHHRHHHETLNQFSSCLLTLTN